MRVSRKESLPRGQSTNAAGLVRSTSSTSARLISQGMRNLAELLFIDPLAFGPLTLLKNLKPAVGAIELGVKRPAAPHVATAIRTVAGDRVKSILVDRH